MAALTHRLLSLCCLCCVAMLGCSGSDSSSKTATTAGAGTKCVLPQDCPNGQTCLAGKCASLSTGTDATGSDAKGSDTAQDTGSDSGSDSGNPATDIGSTDAGPVDTGIQPSSDPSCKSCKVDGDCGDTNYQCIQLISAAFCSRKCAADGDCPTGYKCNAASSDASNKQMYCVLPSFDCGGCAGDPTVCTGTQQCNVNTNPPSCVDVKQQCDSCTQTSDCASGFACVKQNDAGGKVCSPTCSNSKACPENSVCQNFFGTQACAFEAKSCCFGSSCTVSTACSACTPDKCIGGVCVECNVDADCKAGKCNTTVHACVSTASCPPEKPIKLAATGECVECTNDSHCSASAAGNKCDAVAHTCGKGSQGSECSVCTGKYPGCIQINGNWTCVECSTDDDCKAKNAGTCNGTSYSCTGTVGTGVGPTKGSCTQDSDCVNGPTTTFNLKCDVPSGLCYDADGGCDNVVAFCNAAAGSNCVQASSLLPSGGIPGLPGGSGPAPTSMTCSCPLPGSGGGGSGMQPSSSCQLVLQLNLVPALKSCDCSADPNSANCQYFDLTQGKNVACCEAGGSSGGGSGNPLSMLGCMASMMGGGSGSSGTPSASCFGGACNDSGCLAALFGGSAATSTGQGTCAKSGAF